MSLKNISNASLALRTEEDFMFTVVPKKEINLEQDTYTH